MKEIGRSMNLALSKFYIRMDGKFRAEVAQPNLGPKAAMWGLKFSLEKQNSCVIICI